MQVMADPAFESTFPVMSGLFLRPDESLIVGGHCSPGLSEAYWLENFANEVGTSMQDEAACGDLAAQLTLGTSGLLRPKSLDDGLVDSYRWLRLAVGRIGELDPDEHHYAGFFIRTAMEIAAERMTP